MQIKDPEILITNTILNKRHQATIDPGTKRSSAKPEDEPEDAQTPKTVELTLQQWINFLKYYDQKHKDIPGDYYVLNPIKIYNEYKEIDDFTTQINYAEEKLEQILGKQQYNLFFDFIREDLQKLNASSVNIKDTNALKKLFLLYAKIEHAWSGKISTELHSSEGKSNPKLEEGSTADLMTVFISYLEDKITLDEANKIRNGLKAQDDKSLKKEADKLAQEQAEAAAQEEEKTTTPYLLKQLTRDRLKQKNKRKPTQKVKTLSDLINLAEAKISTSKGEIQTFQAVKDNKLTQEQLNTLKKELESKINAVNQYTDLGNLIESLYKKDKTLESKISILTEMLNVLFPNSEDIKQFGTKIIDISKMVIKLEPQECINKIMDLIKNTMFTAGIAKAKIYEITNAYTRNLFSSAISKFKTIIISEINRIADPIDATTIQTAINQLGDKEFKHIEQAFLNLNYTTDERQTNLKLDIIINAIENRTQKTKSEQDKKAQDEAKARADAEKPKQEQLQTTAMAQKQDEGFPTNKQNASVPPQKTDTTAPIEPTAAQANLNEPQKTSELKPKLVSFKQNLETLKTKLSLLSQKLGLLKAALCKKGF